MSEKSKLSSTHGVNQAEPMDVFGALDAPIISFDEAPALGIGDGHGRIMLTAWVHDVTHDGKINSRRKVVAQLRGSPAGLHHLRAAINQMEEMVTNPGGPMN